MMKVVAMEINIVKLVAMKISAMKGLKIMKVFAIKNLVHKIFPNIVKLVAMKITVLERFVVKNLNIATEVI